MSYIIDRFEGLYAVLECEDLTQINVRRNLIPVEAREGDVLDLVNYVYQINHEATMERRRKLEERLKKIKK